MAKYKIPVMINACASTVIGEVECNTVEEFYEKAEKLWEEKDYDAPSANISNDFDLSDWEINDVKDSDLEFYKNDE